MSSRKEYEMLFQLNAQLGGSYNSTFRTAQQSLVSMQKEIKGLSDLQKDISAYQRQQQGIEATKSKLTMLQQQYDNIQREIDETGEFSSDLENKLLSKQQQIERTSAALERQTDQLQEMGDALVAAGVNTDNLTEENARLGAEIDGLKDRQREAAQSAEDFGETSVSAMNELASTITALGIAKLIKEIGNAYAECITVAGDFEESMSNVEALSGASVEELAQLSSLAKELGATTKFTARESADAMGYMAMAGWSAQQMLEGMPGVLQLAAASGEDLAQVSDIVTDSMTAFGLSAADTSRYADVLAQTATKANTNVSMMGETFKSAAPLAGAMGYAVEDVATATGLMANAGIKGSEAGTTLRNILTRLAKPTKESADAMEALGISLTDDAHQMYTFMEIMEQMRDGFADLTEEQKTFYAAELAGQRGMSGLLSIVNASEEDFANLSKAITNSTGAAQRMADIKLDNMNGQLTLLKSAFEAVQTTIGEEFTPTLADLYGEGAKDLALVNDFLKAHPEVIRAVTVFVGLLAAATAGVIGFTAAAKLATAVAATIPGVATAVAATIPGVNVIMGITVAVAALTAGVVAFADAAYAGVPSVRELSEAAQDMQEAMDDAEASFAGMTVEARATADVADMYITRLEEIEAATEGNVQENEEYRNLLTLLTRTVPELADSIDLTTWSIEGGTDALRAQTEAWKKNAEAQAYQAYMNTLMDTYNDVMMEAAENSIKYTQAETKLKKAQDERAKVEEQINKLRGEATEKAAALYKETGILSVESDHLSHEYYQLVNRYEELDAEVARHQATMDNLTAAYQADQAAIAQAEEEIRSAQEAIDGLTEATNEQAEADRQAAAMAEALDITIDSVKARVDLLVESYNEAYTAALDSVGGQYDLWDTADKVVATSAGSINKALESQADYWAKYNTNLERLSERTGEIEGLSEVIASFADGSNKSVNAIAGMAAASDADLRKMVENWQRVQQEQENAAGSIADLKTDFTTLMDELQEELAQDIEAMNLGEDAARSGRATIQGYIDAAADMLPKVQEAYTALAKEALGAMVTSAGGIVKPGMVGTVNISGYADGTTNATPGLHWVGEHGPELMYFRGGEQVISADNSSALIAARGAAPEVNVTFQIAGNATQETVDQLKEYGDDLAEFVLDVVRNAQEDAERGRY